MGLVRIFEISSCPPLVAQQLGVWVLREWSEVGEQRLVQLRLEEEVARDSAETVQAYRSALGTHLAYLAIPCRWRLDGLFSWEAHRRYGVWIIVLWSWILLQLAILADCWEHQLLGLMPADPSRLAGFHADADVWNANWLVRCHTVWLQEVDCE